MNIYLQVDFKSGNIFQFSKTKQEGYESHTNTKGTESWRKIFKKGLYAKFENVSIRDTDFGKELSLATKLANGDNAYLNFPLFDQKKNIASYAESLITVLGSLKSGEFYRFYPYNIKDDESAYGNIGVSVVLADAASETVIEGAEKPARLSYAYTKKDGTVVDGDIPAVIWEEDYTGAKTKNQTAKNKFLYETLVKLTSGTAPAEKPKAESSPSMPETAPHDDLPF